MTKNMFHAAMIIGLMSSVLAAKAQAQDAKLGDAVLFVNGSSVTELRSTLDQEVGYRLDSDDLSASFLVDDQVQRLFAGAARLRTNLPAGKIPSSFDSLVNDITATIDKTAPRTSEKDNGITNKGLAQKIVRASFCFGTDPTMVAAQIETESNFDKKASAYKKGSIKAAVGLTQMTDIAIDEVHDQLGNRGIKGANPSVLPFLNQATSCYLGGSRFVDAVDAGIIPRGTLVHKNSAMLAKAKTWIVSSIDRQLIYGQITLKVNLARAHSKGKTGKAAYTAGLQGYNGEKTKARYASRILGRAKKI